MACSELNAEEKPPMSPKTEAEIVLVLVILAVFLIIALKVIA